MQINVLSKEISFPPVHLASEEGILAVGGDLSPERLLHGYENGIFPWFSRGDPIIWWSPDPRFVLFPQKVKISRSMKKILSRGEFEITADTVFRDVINGCTLPRKRERGTWITREMMDAYIRLHELGYAHSVEAWKDGVLAGGLYGISIGRNFFGESMFARVPNASKAAFLKLAQFLGRRNFKIIDCQVYTAHLDSLGAEHISRDNFLEIIKSSTGEETLSGNWKELFESE